MKLRYYITGHGLGHASRSCQIIAALRRRHPRLAIEVTSSAAPWFLAQDLPPDVPLRVQAFDFGVLQRDSLQMDLPATASAGRALLQNRPRLVAAEAASLHQSSVCLVAADVPFLPCAAAAAAGIPAVGVSNFGWDWIYDGLAATEPGLAELAAAARADYGTAAGILSLPFAGGLESFRRCQPLPLVARHASHPASTTRRLLGIAPDARVGLISFGGFGLEQLDLAPLARLAGWIFLVDRAFPGSPDNVRLIPANTCPYPDLVAASDVIVTKPGYGIVSEAIAHGRAVLYARRGDFREQECLIAGLERFARAREIGDEPLRRGLWGEALEALLAQPGPLETLAADGDLVAADRLAALAENGGW